MSLLLNGAASGAVLYSNFGPGSSYQAAGNLTYSSVSGNDFDLAAGFMTGSSAATFDSVRLALLGNVGVGDDFQLWLMDSSFNILETINYTAPLSLTFGATVTVNASGTILLQPSTLYRIGISTTGPDSVTWNRAISDLVANLSLRTNGGGWDQSTPENFALEVSGTPVVPEPSSVGLAALGAAALLTRRQWRRTRLWETRAHASKIEPTEK